MCPLTIHRMCSLTINRMCSLSKMSSLQDELVRMEDRSVLLMCSQRVPNVFCRMEDRFNVLVY